MNAKLEGEILRAVETICQLKADIGEMTVARERRVTYEHLMSSIATLAEIERDLNTLRQRLASMAKIAQRAGVPLS